MEKKKFYITTPIYYPSGRFHIGTAYTTVFADALKRYKIQKGFDTYMLTGTDEHGQKIETVAKNNNMEPQAYTDLMADMAKALWKKMDIHYDYFIRTTEKRHQEAVQKIFDRLMEQGDIYKGTYEGLYCMPCETYFTSTQAPNEICPDCGRALTHMKEEAYFFNMKKYADRLLQLYENEEFIVTPEFRKKEMINNFIKPGLEDLCVSRTKFSWGIPVKKDPKHVVYVWLDALTNYITALGYESDDDTLFKKYWPADVQVIGKDIARFHLIYWPIFLMALGLPLPKRFFVHNWFMMKDGKMSKSKGNVIYPEVLIDRYGLDATKYYLLRELPILQDGIFSPESFVERFNFDLCNDLGNLLNRTVSMVNKYFDGIVPTYQGHQNKPDEEIEEFAQKQVERFEENMEKLDFSNAIAEIWQLISRSNKYIDETEPWVLAKDEESKAKLASCMYHLVENLRKVAIMLESSMPETSLNILNQLGIKKADFESIYKYDQIPNNTKVIEKGIPLFMRLNVEEEVEYIKNAMKSK